MTKVSFITYDGVQHDVEADAGSTVMEAAMRNGVPGIEADCGGACACGTCHVYIEAEWLNALPPRVDTEAEMLEFAAYPQANSRLACQIRLTAALEGLTVRLPVSQH